MQTILGAFHLMCGKSVNQLGPGKRRTDRCK
jgi:hypothetical protein